MDLLRSASLGDTQLRCRLSDSSAARPRAADPGAQLPHNHAGVAVQPEFIRNIAIIAHVGELMYLIKWTTRNDQSCWCYWRNHRVVVLPVMQHL